MAGRGALTGEEIGAIRRDHDLSHAELAALLVASLSSVYRWEHHAGAVKIDPLHYRLLVLLRTEYDRRTSPRERADWRSTIKRAAVLGGSLAGLRTMLEASSL